MWRNTLLTIGLLSMPLTAWSAQSDEVRKIAPFPRNQSPSTIWIQGTPIAPDEKARLLELLSRIARYFERPKMSLENESSGQALDILMDRVRVTVRNERILEIYFHEPSNDTIDRKHSGESAPGFHIFTAREFEKKVRALYRKNGNRPISNLYLNREVFRHPERDPYGFVSEILFESRKVHPAKLPKRRSELDGKYDEFQFEYEKSTRLVRSLEDALSQEADLEFYEDDALPDPVDRWIHKTHSRECPELLLYKSDERDDQGD